MRYHVLATDYDGTLAHDGRVDKPTLDSLNVPAHARLAQLKLNLQRIHDLMAQRIEDRYVLVNPPAFQLEAVEFNEVAQRHRVIAGKPDRQTPTVKATIRALNSGNIDTFMENNLHPDDFEVFEDLDPTMDGFGKFVADVSRLSGESLGKSSGRSKSGSGTRRS